MIKRGSTENGEEKGGPEREHCAVDLIGAWLPRFSAEGAAAGGRAEAAMAGSRLYGKVSEGWVTYAYLLVYVALSSGQIFFNKWVLSSKEINFPYPVALTLLHMVFSSVLCFILTKVFKIIKIEEGMTTEIHVAGLLIPSLIFCNSPPNHHPCHCHSCGQGMLYQVSILSWEVK
ncbi:hypothetical protein Taro_038288, partial [Colocasia esculenta]|nr:hypothetical protein [Colocasia esculenta]